MSNQMIGIIIGGVLPAIFLGLFSFFQKFGSREGVTPGAFLVVVGLTITLIGVVITAISRSGGFSVKGSIYTVLSGIFWALSLAGISYALSRYNVPMSKLNPIFNANTLTTVVLSLFLLGEWSEVNLLKVIAGAALVVVGAVVVSQA